MYLFGKYINFSYICILKYLRMALGSAVGGILGGIIGGVTTLGIGAPMGAAIGSSIGGLAEGQIKKRKAEDIDLPLTDPLQVSLLNDLLKKRVQLETGMAYKAQTDSIRQMGLAAMRNAMKLSGGNVGAAMSGMSNINRGTARSLNELYGQMSIEALRLNQMIGQQGDAIARRRLQIPLMEKAKLEGDAAQIQKDALANLQNVLVRSGDVGGGLDNIGIRNTLNSTLTGNANNSLPSLNTSSFGSGGFGGNSTSPFSNWSLD